MLARSARVCGSGRPAVRPVAIRQTLLQAPELSQHSPMRRRPALRMAYINGRFLEQRPSGVQRYATQLVLALDKLLESKEFRETQWQLLHPSNSTAPWLRDLKAITACPVGKMSGHLWEQVELSSAAQDGPLINLCNTAPLFRRRQIVVLHDALIYRMPEMFGWRYVAAHKIMDFCVSRLSARIGTVSAFSKMELSAALKIQSSKIDILPNGHEHVRAIVPDYAILDRLGLIPRSFFLFVGNFAGNKNLPLLLAAMKEVRQRKPDARLVVVGGAVETVFQGQAIEQQAGVEFVGRLSDDALMALYSFTAALVFPSFYEGFGIPPLEALAMGARVVTSRIPPVEEVCGEHAIYFDTQSPAELALILLPLLGVGPSNSEQKSAVHRAEIYSWGHTAQLLDNIVISQYW